MAKREQKTKKSAGRDTTRERNRAGRATAVRIVEAAYEILRTGNYENLTMQGVAYRLGIRLSNVQYYFRTRSELIKAIMEYVGNLYDQRYQEILARAGESPAERFRAAVEFNFTDIGDPDTRHFFIQLWPLLSTADNYSGELMQRLYEPQLKQLTVMIMELTPQTTRTEARLRAELIAAIFEGLMVTSPASVDTAAHRKRLKAALINTAFSIAIGNDKQQ